ncbi:MAG TPA: hypothetical protein VK171_02570 [Fimbriimonas sp.]|nr:hypothetical protein [Fimbriimonas sp.]
MPDWLQSVTVDFVCNNCPNRQLKNIAFVDLDAGLKSGKPLEGEIEFPPTEDEEAELD